MTAEPLYRGKTRNEVEPGTEVLVVRPVEDTDTETNDVD